jgi:DNA primase
VTGLGPVDPQVAARLSAAAAEAGSRDGWARWLALAGQARVQTDPAGDPALLVDPLTRLFHARGYTLATGEPGQVRVDRAQHTVTLQPAVTADLRIMQDLAHAAAHLMLHPDRDPQADCAGQDRAEALSVAYLVAAHAGITLPIPDALPDPQQWAAGADPAGVVREATRRVWSAADRLGHALTPGPQAHAQQLRDTRRRAAAHRTADLATRAQALRVYADSSLPLPPPQASAEHARLYDAICAADRWYTLQLAGAVDGPAWQMLTERGLADIASDPQWMVGYAPPGWTGLTDHLRSLGFTDQELLDAGLAARTRRGTLVDRFRNRLLFGLRDGEGRIVGFIGRALDGQTPKYLNSPGTVLFDKSRLLFGLAEQKAALAAGARPVLVEGPTDVLAVAVAARQTGRPLAAVAACGTAFTAEHAQLLDRATPGREGITVAYDPDPAGLQAAARAYQVLRDLDPRLHHATLHDGLDPAELLVSAGPAALHTALTDPARLRPLAAAVIDQRTAWLDDGPRFWVTDPNGSGLATEERIGEAYRHVPDHRFAALRTVAPLIATEDPSRVSKLIAYTADSLNLRLSDVTSAVLDAVSDLSGAALARLRTASIDAPTRPAVAPDRGALAHTGRQAAAGVLAAAYPPADRTSASPTPPSHSPPDRSQPVPEPLTTRRSRT